MIEILIPTYNRSEDLIKNIIHIDKLIRKEGLDNKFLILISNNASTDDTLLALNNVRKKIKIELLTYNQEENIGLESNAVFVLKKATSEYVMFLGDDDYLPDGYLTKLVEIAESKKYGVVIPGFSALMPNGEIREGRSDFCSRENKPGFKAIMDFSKFGHQLSGLFFKREEVAESYTSDAENRNIYLFMFFISHVMLKNNSIYLPEFQVLVSQGNSKDWSYDDSGLLTEIFRNYRGIYPDSSIKRFLLCTTTMKNATWRMRLGANPLLAIKSFVHLLKSKECDPLLKISLPFLYPCFYMIAIFNYFKSKRKYI